MIAKKLGFEIVSEIAYNQWMIDDQIIFTDPGTGNYSAAFMKILIKIDELNKNDKIDEEVKDDSQLE